VAFFCLKISDECLYFGMFRVAMATTQQEKRPAPPLGVVSDPMPNG